MMEQIFKNARSFSSLIDALNAKVPTIPGFSFELLVVQNFGPFTPLTTQIPKDFGSSDTVAINHYNYLLTAINFIRNVLVYKGIFELPFFYINQTKKTVLDGQIIGGRASQWTWDDLVAEIGEDPLALLEDKKHFSDSVKSKILSLLYKISDLLVYRGTRCAGVLLCMQEKKLRRAYSGGPINNTVYYTNGEYGYNSGWDFLFNTVSGNTVLVDEWNNHAVEGHVTVNPWDEGHYYDRVLSSLGNFSLFSGNSTSHNGYPISLAGWSFWYGWEIVHYKFGFVLGNTVASTEQVNFDNIQDFVIPHSGIRIELSNREVDVTRQKIGGVVTSGNADTTTETEVIQNAGLYTFDLSTSLLFNSLIGEVPLTNGDGLERFINNYGSFSIASDAGDTGAFYYVEKLE